jgi:hypothetical protein
MNLSSSPSKSELQRLLASCDDTKADHILWVDRTGNVFISPLRKGLAPSGFAKSQPKLLLRYETFDCGGGHVGPEAANDKAWVSRLVDSLVKEWARCKGARAPVYIDRF